MNTQTQQRPLKPLQDKIQRKFDSISNFCRIAGFDRTELQVLFRVKNPDPETVKAVRDAYLKCKNVRTGNVVSPERMKALQKAIHNAGGAYTFTKDAVDSNGEPLFDTRAVYYVLNGQRTRMSKLIKRLLDHFKI